MAEFAVSPALQNLVAGVRRREIVHLLLTQGLVALSIGAGGVVLLLVLGTQVLDWYWPLLLAALSFAYLLWRLRGKIPTPYQAAQIADRRLSTADLFSSAWHFQAHPGKPLGHALAAEAERVAATFSPQMAAPWQAPRGWGRAVAVSCVALSLLVFRYAFQSSLDLQQPLAPGLYSLLASGEKPTPQTQKQAKGAEPLPLDGFETAQATKSPEEQAMEKGREIEAESQNATDSAASGQKPGQFQDSLSPNEEGENIEGAQKSDGASRAEDPNGESREDKKDAKDFAKKNQPDPKQNRGDQKGDNSSLMDKFKDAMANLMNKMKNDDKNQGQSQQTKDNQQGQQGAGQQQKASQGQEAQGKQQANAQQAGEQQQGQQQGEGGEKTPSQQAKGGDKNGQPPPSDAKSGMGKQDGNKSVELAQQEEAMGKISELFGKRAQNIQGEIMIEVSSSKSQQLKTGYSGKSAAHSDKAGVIRRDEVPLEMQGYVKRYFEEIRKSPPPAKANP